MFGLAGDSCPTGFEEIPPERFDWVERVLLQQGLARVVPEMLLLKQGRCRVAACTTETPPAILLDPTAPKVTLSLTARPGSVAVRTFLQEVEQGQGFLMHPDLEPMLSAAGREHSALRMRVFSASHLRPDVRARPEGERVLLGPHHASLVAELPDEGLGFLECYDTIEQFLSSPLPGAASIADGVLVSMCAVYAYADTACEVAVYTQPEHRGRGHATAAAALCLHEIQRRGGQPVWTAVDDASRRLAIRLGLAPVTEKLYAVLAKPPRVTAPPAPRPQ